MKKQTHDVINFRLSRDYHERLKAIAKQERRTKSNVIELILERGIDKYDQSQRKEQKQA